MLPSATGRGKTPEASISAALYVQAKHEGGIAVKTKNPGEFKLNPKRKVRDMVTL